MAEFWQKATATQKQKIVKEPIEKDFKSLDKIGVKGLEPSTPCSQDRYATRLRYTPIIKEMNL